MAQTTSRRHFLQTAPLAAAAANLPATASLGDQTTTVTPPALFHAEDLAQHAAELKRAPGNYNFYTPAKLPLTCVMTVETAKSAKEFEWHEGRDHILQVLDGETVYEVGGTPVNGRNTKPGEWLAPSAQGATTMALKKGDVLIIPRNTPHKRSTAASVTFYLFSTTGAVGG